MYGIVSRIDAKGRHIKNHGRVLMESRSQITLIICDKTGRDTIKSFDKSKWDVRVFNEKEGTQ